MIPLRCARYEPVASGEPLPEVYPELTAAGVAFRRGQVSLIVSAPGQGKSVIAQNLAMKAKVPTLYMSADTDWDTMYTRGIAMVLPDWSLAQVEATARDSGPPPVLAEYDHVKWVWDDNPTTQVIWECCDLMALTHGEYPHLIVLDTITNIADEEGRDGAGAWEASLVFAAGLAKRTGAHVMCLHHLTGDFDNGDRAPTQGAVRGKVSKLPSMILGIYTPIAGIMGVTVIKNRRGRASTQGTVCVELVADFSMMRIGRPQR